MHLQPAFRGFGALATGVSERLFKDGLALPSGSALTPADSRFVIEGISGWLDQQ